MKQFTHMLTIADVCCESIKAWHFLAKSSLFIWPKMTLGKVILWLFATSLMASFSMESTNDHWTHHLSSALLPISIDTEICPPSDIKLSQTEWNM